MTWYDTLIRATAGFSVKIPVMMTNFTNNSHPIEAGALSILSPQRAADISKKKRKGAKPRWNYYPVQARRSH